MLRYATLFLFILMLAPAVARAKDASWWDCFFREFELCSTKANDPDAPAASGPGNKGFCDGKARANCDEEERKKEVQQGGAGTNSKKGLSSSTVQLNAAASANPSKPDEMIATPSSAIVEGIAPSGDKTVLGVDVTLGIAQVAESYKARNVRGCHPIEDSYTRHLCVDAPGAAGGAPIELEYYRGHLVSLSYEPASDNAVGFRPAVSVAEDKTGARAVQSSTTPDPVKPGSEIPSRYCTARFPLGGGTLTLQGLPAEAKGDACSFTNSENAALSRVEWLPSFSAQREVAEQRRVDRNPAQQKKEDVTRAKALLPL